MSTAEVTVAERVLTTEGIGVRPGLAARLRAYTELTKPGITRMVVLTAAAGFYLATRGPLDIFLLLHTLVGTALVASAAGALNQLVERDADGRMRRTARRPIPSGRISTAAAVTFSAVVAALGLAQLLAFVNATTALIVALSLVSYVFVYTPLKRRTWVSTVVGAVPGALPILAGWAGAGTPLDARAWALFAVLFLWQMPHFYALAWVYREDYIRGGFRMLTAFDPTGRRTVRQVILYTAALLAASVLPYTLGVAGAGYLWGALGLGAAFLFLGGALARERTDNSAWKLFFGSIVYLPALLILLVVFKTPL